VFLCGNPSDNFEGIEKFRGGWGLRSLPASPFEAHQAEQNLPEWQTAIACLIGAAEGRDFMMHARIGMLRALNRDVERVFGSARKDIHWGRRKLKRDQ
jgi:hypothetical protein